jgi:hypothetical protein
MALKDRIVEIAYELKDRFTGQVSKVTGSFRKVEKAADDSAEKIERSNQRAAGSFGAIGAAASKAKGAILLIGAAIAGGIAAISKWTQAAAVQERAETKLATTLRNLTGAREDEIKALYDQASALQQTTGYGDETTISAQAMLATFQLTAQEIAVLTPRLLDMAEAARKAGKEEVDLESISIALGKAFTAGVGSLSRYGVAMSEAQKEAFKLADQQEKVQILAEILDGNFRGLAEAIGNEYEGAIRKANAAHGDYLETLGQMFTQNEQWVGFMQYIAESWEKMTGSTKESSKEINAAISWLARGITASFEHIRLIWNGLQLMIKIGASLILTAIRGVVVALESITFGEVSEAFRLMKEDIDRYGGELLRGIEEDGDDIADAVNNIGQAFGVIGEDAKDAVDGIEKVSKATRDAKAEAGKGGLSAEVAKATANGNKELAKALKERIKIYQDALKQVKDAEKEQAAIANEFGSAVTEIKNGGDGKDVDFIDASKQRLDAKQALDAGDTERAVQLAREGVAMLKQMQQEGDGATVAMTGLAKEFERIANAAAQSDTEKAIQDAAEKDPNRAIPMDVAFSPEQIRQQADAGYAAAVEYINSLPPLEFKAVVNVSTTGSNGVSIADALTQEAAARGEL